MPISKVTQHYLIEKMLFLSPNAATNNHILMKKCPDRSKSLVFWSFLLLMKKTSFSPKEMVSVSEGDIA